MHKVLNKLEKASILGRLLPLVQSFDRMASDWEVLGEEEKEILKQKAQEAQMASMGTEIGELLRRYLEGLPVLALSRCPFSGEVLSMAIDNLGLDGLWWNSDAPKRPESKFPETYFGLDGALKLVGEPEDAPFLCCPGPDVPFVLPRLLEFVQIKAVLSCLKIGPHTAYPIVYYADPMLYGEERVNDWGTEHYWDKGSISPGFFTAGQYVSLAPDPNEYDFDLAPWIKAGKLLWIAPGDESLTLHGSVSRCPFLNLPGSRSLKYIQNGKVWEDDGAYEMRESDGASFDREHFRKLVEQLEKGDK